MKYINITTILMLFFPVIAFSGTAKQDHRNEQKCNYLKSKKLDLTGNGEHETVSVSVYGKNCAAAKYTLTIESSSKKRMYGFSQPFKFMYVAHRYDKEETQLAAERLIERNSLFDRSIMPNIKKLVHVSELQGIQEFYSVTKNKYMKLKAQNLPYISHPTSYESGVYLTYDKEREKIVKFGGY